jgi:putative endonuclease
MTGKRSLVSLSAIRRNSSTPHTFFAVKKQIMFYVYALYSREYKKIYIGFTSDLEKRLFSHNNGLKNSYTSKFRPWSLIYSEEISDKKSALIREKQLKTAQGREYIKSLIPC